MRPGILTERVERLVGVWREIFKPPFGVYPLPNGEPPINLAVLRCVSKKTHSTRLY